MVTSRLISLHKIDIIEPYKLKSCRATTSNYYFKKWVICTIHMEPSVFHLHLEGIFYLSYTCEIRTMDSAAFLDGIIVGMSR